jgi:PhnB protein
MSFNTYIHFNGNCEEAFRFYEKTFRGKIEMSMTYGQSPAAGQFPDLKDKIIHVRLTVGDSLLMGCDAPSDRYHRPTGFNINIGLNDAKEGERLFNELSAGGNVVMKYEKTFWAERFGMLTDRFGIPWMVNVENHEQLSKAAG